MEDLFKMILTTENIRLGVLLVAMVCGFVWLRGDMHKEIASLRRELGGEITSVRGELGGEITSVRRELGELKTNDIAHLCDAIEALTFTLVKNNTITTEDKEYIDSRLKSRSVSQPSYPRGG